MCCAHRRHVSRPTQQSLFSAKIYFDLKRNGRKTSAMLRSWSRPKVTESFQWPFSAESAQHPKVQPLMPLGMGNIEFVTRNWPAQKWMACGKPMKCWELRSNEWAKQRMAIWNSSQTSTQIQRLAQHESQEKQAGMIFHSGHLRIETYIKTMGIKISSMHLLSWAYKQLQDMHFSKSRNSSLPETNDWIHHWKRREQRVDSYFVYG